MTKVTRVEVIHRGVGRLYTNHDVDDAWVSIQDDGLTIKVFINESLEEPSEDKVKADNLEKHIEKGRKLGIGKINSNL